MATNSRRFTPLCSGVFTFIVSRLFRGLAANWPLLPPNLLLVNTGRLPTIYAKFRMLSLTKSSSANPPKLTFNPFFVTSRCTCSARSSAMALSHSSREITPFPNSRRSAPFSRSSNYARDGKRRRRQQIPRSINQENSISSSSCSMPRGESASIQAAEPALGLATILKIITNPTSCHSAGKELTRFEKSIAREFKGF